MSTPAVPQDPGSQDLAFLWTWYAAARRWAFVRSGTRAALIDEARARVDTARADGSSRAAWRITDGEFDPVDPPDATAPDDYVPFPEVFGPCCVNCGADARRTSSAAVNGKMFTLVVDHLAPGTDPDAAVCVGSGVPPVSGDPVVDGVRRHACDRIHQCRATLTEKWQEMVTTWAPGAALAAYAEDAVSAEEEGRLWRLTAVCGTYGLVVVEAAAVLALPVPDHPFRAAVLAGRRAGAWAWLNTVRDMPGIEGLSLSADETAALLRML